MCTSNGEPVSQEKQAVRRGLIDGDWAVVVVV